MQDKWEVSAAGEISLPALFFWLFSQPKSGLLPTALT